MAVTAADLQVKFSTSGADKVTGDIGKVNKGIGSLVKNAAAVGVGVLGANTFGIMARGFAGAVGGALDFGKQMANVNSIAQVSDAQLASLSDQVLRMATDPRISAAPATLAAGLYEINSSGFAGADAMNILEKAAIAGTAGLTSTDTAARAITASLNAYGLGADQAQRVSDVLFKTVDSGVITFDQLANNLGNVLPIANSLGVGIEEVGAAYAQMTLSGVSASQAETQIASLMRSALNPTQQLTDAVQSHGYASAAAAIEQEGLAGFLDIVNEAAGGNQETMMDLLGTQEAMNAATILGKNNTDDYRKAIEEMNAASADGGATQKALEKQMKSASFQLDKAKQAAQIFVTRGIGLISPAIGAMARGFTSFMTRGAIPFIDIMAKALTGSFKFREMLVDLPEPLRRFAGGLGTVLEGVGDLAEFMLQGDWNRVAQRLPGELRQIVGGLRAMGDELAQGARFVANIAIDLVTSFAGWLWDNRGAIWEGVKSLVGWGVGQITEVLNWTLDVAAPTVGGWIDEVGGDLAGWLHGQIFGGGAAARGREFSRGQIGAASAGTGEIVVEIANWTIDVGIPRFAQTAGDVVVGFREWVHDQFRGVEANTGSDWTLNVDDPQQREARGTRFSNWLDDTLEREFLGYSFNLREWEFSVNNPAMNLTVADVIGWLDDTLEGLAGIDVEVQDWRLDFGAPQLPQPSQIGQWLDDWMEGAIGLDIELQDWTLNVAMPAFGDFVSNLDIVTAIRDKIGSITASLTDITTFNLDIPDISVPSAGEIGQAILGKIPGGIKVNITDLVEFVMGEPDPATTSGSTSSGSGSGASGTFGTGGGGAFRPLVLPAPDTSVFDKAISGALENARKIATEDFTATIRADASPFVGVVAASLDAGQAFGNLTFEPTLDADIGPFGAVMQQAWTAGGLFAAETFRATLDANAGPALGAIGQAIGAASAFARTWTATLTVDTSGAIAAAQAAVQFISDLLPNSPAKRGPLARMPSFSYLGDALLDEAGRMNRVFTGALTPPGDVAFAGGGVGGAVAGRPTHVTYQTINMGRTNFRHGYDWERFVKEKQRQAAVGSVRP